MIQKKNDPKNKHQEPYYDDLKTSSAQDQTGLIPSGITSDEELAAYEDLYPFLPFIPSSKKRDASQ